MANRIEGLDDKIAESALQEFMEYGFNNASTNRIAKNAGVTSGALYIRYKNKDEIFESLVNPAIQGLDDLITSQKGNYSDLAEKLQWQKFTELETRIMNDLLDFIFDNHSMFVLLVCKSNGSRVSDFDEKLITFKYERTMRLIKKVKEDDTAVNINKEALCPEEVALLCSSQYYTVFDTVRRGYSKEQAKKYIHTIMQIYSGGLISRFLNGDAYEK